MSSEMYEGQSCDRCLHQMLGLEYRTVKVGIEDTSSKEMWKFSLLLATATKSFQDLDAGMAPGLTTTNARANGVLMRKGYGED
jgi:hypothetical protein